MSLPRFGVTKPVPVNLLMAATILAGVFCAFTLTKEFFPETTPEMASVTLPYPGATPEEIEESLAKKVEDKLADLDEVEQLTTTLAEGGGGIMVEFRDGVDVTKATDEVERAIDTLTDLPDESERITVTEFEPVLPTIMLTLFGSAPEEVMKRSIRRIRDDLKTLPGMGDIQISGVREYEIRVDVASDALLEHRISLPQLADRIGAWMKDVPGGTVRSGEGNINVRVLGTAERAEAIREIAVMGTPDGQVLRVSDIAEVREHFVDEQIVTRFRRGDRSGASASLTVFKVGDQDAVEIAEMVRAYAAGLRGRPFEMKLIDRLHAVLSPPGAGEARLASPRRDAYDLGAASAGLVPPECDVEVHSDLARFIEGRLGLLSRNAAWGAVLVFSVLLIFLNWRVALWVGVGLTVALCGTLLLMKTTGITLNLLTMFGLIVVLGLLVDDAIVVAENIQARHDRSEPSLVAAIKGTEEVFWPVVATVITSIVAFMPLLFIKGQIGDLLGALPIVVTCALLMSLVESVLILPSHMGHSLVHRDKAHTGRWADLLRRLEAHRDHVIRNRIIPAYARVVSLSLHYRYVSLSIALATLLISLGMVAGRRVEFTFLPASDSETIIVDLKLPTGTPIDTTEQVTARIEEAAARQPETKTVSTLVGVRTNVDDTSGLTSGGFGTHLAQMFIELVAVEHRERESASVIASIRESIGVIDDVESLKFSEIQGGPGGADISIRVSGEADERVDEVVRIIRGELATFEGVVDIADDKSVGQREVKMELKPGAAALGFTIADVARQMRGALFGIDAHVYAAEREDIDVRVRLDEDSRRRLDAIENMWVIGPTGDRVPLTEIVDLREGSSYSNIKRVDRRRAVTVTADTLPGANPEDIMRELTPRLDDLRSRYRDVRIESAGRQRQLEKAFASLPVGFLAAVLMIYVVLAWLFSSYSQPLAVMLAIPFGLIGVVWGHFVMGYQMTFLSLIGFVALSGIVVNDSLIFVEFYNDRRRDGAGVIDGLVDAGRQRLRPIFLTTITTVCGLTPLMLEQSFQAKFLIPMAISIAFGLMSATVLILLVLPCLILIVEDVKDAAHLLWHGRARTPSTPAPTAVPLEPD